MTDTTLSAGSIAFTGYDMFDHSDPADRANFNVNFVVTTDIAAGTTINFTDNNWNGTQFVGGESTWSWTATSDIAAGTVVTMQDMFPKDFGGTVAATSNLGTVSYSGTQFPEFSAETLYAYTGTADAPNFVSAMANWPFFPNQSLLDGTGLEQGVTAVNLSSVQNNSYIAAYTGPTSGFSTMTDYLAAINNPDNWSMQQFTGGDIYQDGTAPDLPLSSAPFTTDPSVQTISFAADSLNVSTPEGQPGDHNVLTFVIQRTGGTSGIAFFHGTLVVDPASGITADDFGGKWPTFSGSIADGQSSTTITIPVSGDLKAEADESFKIALDFAANPNVPVVIGGGNTANATIVNDDTAQTVGFAPDSQSMQVVEGDSGQKTLVFTIQRTAGGTLGDVQFTVTFAPFGTTTDKNDFGGTLPTTFTGVILDGQTSGTFSLNISGDTMYETNESFQLLLTSVTNDPVGATIDNSASSSFVTILNDDQAPANLGPGQVAQGTITVSGDSSFTVGAGATLSVQSAPIFHWSGANSNATINNYGTINGDDLLQLDGDTSGTLTINNFAGGTFSGSEIDIQSSVQAGSTIVFNNAGTVNEISHAFVMPTSGGSLILNNLASGVLTGADASVDIIKQGANDTINNWGRIVVPADTINADGNPVSLADAIDVGNGTGDIIHNYAGGIIEGSRHAVTGKRSITVINDAGATMIGRNGSAVNIDNTAAVSQTVFVTNHGDMEGRSADLDDSDGDAIDVDGLLHLDNYGIVQGLGANGVHKGGANVSEGVAIGGGVINNYAGGEIYGYGRAIQVDDSAQGPELGATTIYNEGLIRGDGNGPTNFDPGTDEGIFLQNREAIDIIGTLADTITNKGQIVGGVFTDGGNDVFNAYTGSTVTGLIDLGDGNDTLNLYADAGSTVAGVMGQFVNVETVNVVGGNWTLTNGAGSANVEIENASALNLSGTSTGAIVVDTGGSLYDYGTTSNVTVKSGGAMHVYDGGSASNTTVAAGGYQDIWNGSSATGTILSGNQQILAGGTATDTTIENGGYEYVGAGGEADGTVIQAGGFQYVDVGGTAKDTVVNGGYQIVMGAATGGSTDAGASADYGISIGATIENGGAQHVYDGGQALSATIAAGGFQDVSDATVTGTKLSGYQQVLAGGSAVNTTVLNGGDEYVGAGGTTNGTVINAGGLEYVDVAANAANTAIRGGFMFDAGTVTGASVNNGGELDVTGLATSTKLVNGVERVLAGGIQNGVDFGGGAAGVLTLDNAANLQGTVSNFETGDIIDIGHMSVSSFAFDGSTLTLATAGGNVALSFSGLAAGAAFNVTDDGKGGSQIALLAQHVAGFASNSVESGLVPSQDNTQVQPTLASHA